jgi:hypothetical protein
VKPSFTKGEHVVHSGRPEWGPGEILAVEAITHEGKPAHRLTVRFSRIGTKVLNTAFAAVQPASSVGGVRAAEVRAESAQPALPQERPAPTLAESDILRIPEDAIDPFLPVSRRLTTTLNELRYYDKATGWMDWSVARSGLADPLSAATRAQLEQWFERYRVLILNHLRKLLREQGPPTTPAELERLAARIGPTAVRTLKEALSRR